MEQKGYNLTDRDVKGYNPSLKRFAKKEAQRKAKIEIKKLSPADSPIAKQIEKILEQNCLKLTLITICLPE